MGSNILNKKPSYISFKGRINDIHKHQNQMWSALLSIKPPCLRRIWYWNLENMPELPWSWCRNLKVLCVSVFFYPIWISKYWRFGLVFWTCSSSPAIAITRPQPKSPMHQAPTPQFTQVRCSNLIGVLLISTVYNSWVFD